MGFRAIAAIVLLAAHAPGVRAAEITVQNDSVPGGGAGTPVATFLAGERVSAWLTTPVAGDLVAVQIDWRSQFGGAPSSIEMAITVHAVGVFPTPGATLATLTGPTLSDTGINEFRLFDPAMGTPLQIPLVAGQTIVVALEFLNTNSGNPFAPSVVSDGDGCQPGLNGVYPLPAAAWSDACPLGVVGDFVIRAVVDEAVPVPAAGAAARWLLAALLLGLGGAVGGRRFRRIDYAHGSPRATRHRRPPHGHRNR